MTQRPPSDRSNSDDVLIRADNGDVIRFDETGLVLRLSDRVLEDIAARLSERGLLPSGQSTQKQSNDEGDIELPEGIDAWAVRREGDWIHFSANLPGKLGSRGYLCKGRADAIIADTQTPILALLAIGGSRASLGIDQPCAFPNHIVAPGDDIGAVGLDGEGNAIATADLHLLRELSHEALVAEAILNDAVQRQSALPLFIARAETDGSTSAAKLAEGTALANLVQAASNVKAAAKSLEKHANIMGVFLDFALEDTQSSPSEYRDAMIQLMENITRAFAADGIPAPRFLSFFECGTAEVVADNILEGQWELAWNHAAHDLTIVAPGYMLELDEDARLPADAKLLRAAISAEALAVVEDGSRWFCPTLHLAEMNGDKIKVTAQCHGKLVLDDSDPFGAGPHYGFALDGVDDGVEIKTVQIDPKDSKALLVTCTRPVTGPAPVLRYASGKEAGQGAGFPANCGALRDEFSPALHHNETAFDLSLLRRWALPARLKIT